MKIAIPLFLLLFVAAAAAVHRTAPPAGEGISSPARPSSGAPGESPAALAEPGQVRTVPVVPFSAAPPAGTAPAAKAAPPATWQKLMGVLDRGVGPTSIQRPALEQVLRDREEEIKALHQSILRSGVIDIRRYDWQADTLKDAWYRKIDALLDRAQHEKFLVLVQQGFLNEELAFTVEPGMTVLE